MCLCTSWKVFICCSEDCCFQEYNNKILLSPPSPKYTTTTFSIQQNVIRIILKYGMICIIHEYMKGKEPDTQICQRYQDDYNEIFNPIISLVKNNVRICYSHYCWFYFCMEFSILMLSLHLG